MIFRFGVYRRGSNEVLLAELEHAEEARVEACRVLELSTRNRTSPIAHGEQVRVVVSDEEGSDLFTVAYLAAKAPVPHETQQEPLVPTAIILEV